MGTVNPGRVNVVTTPWSNNWLTHADDGAALTDLGFSSFAQTLVASVDRAAHFASIGSNLQIAQAIQQDRVFDVRWFGAVGDGVADDTAAIQAAIDAAIAAGGGIVFFPVATFRVTGTLDATGAVPVGFLGASMTGAIIRYDSLVDVPVLALGSVWTGSESRGWQAVRNFSIQGAVDDLTRGDGIFWQSANPKALLEQVYIRGFKRGLATTSDWGCTYRDSYISYCGTGLALLRQPNGVQLAGLYLQRCELGIDASEAYQLAVRNCVIERNTSYAMNITGGGPIVVDGLYFETDLGGDTTINVVRKSGISCASLQVQNCHVNNDSQYFIRGQAIDELVVRNNAMMTPPENHVLVLSDTQTLTNGIKHAVIEGNTTLDFSGSGYDAMLKKYLCRELGASNPVRWDVGYNYDYTTRGTIYYGSLNALPLGVVTNMWDEQIPQAAWDSESLTGFSVDAQSDAGTASPHTYEAGHEVLKLVHGGSGGWAAYRYTRTIDLSALRAVFAATGNLRVRMRCWAKNAKICVRTAGLQSSTARAGSYELIELETDIDVNSGTAYRIGYEVGTSQTGYVGPIDITIMGTKADLEYEPRDWPLIALDGSIQWNPGSLADAAGETSAAITVTGAVLGDFVLVGAPYDLQNCTVTGYVQAADTVEIRLQNESGGVRDLADGLWRVRVFKR